MYDIRDGNLLADHGELIKLSDIKNLRVEQNPDLFRGWFLIVDLNDGETVTLDEVPWGDRAQADQERERLLKKIAAQ